MLKKRIIPKFLIRGGKLVKGVQFFGNMREAGNPVSTAKVYDSYGVDELVFLDIDATREKRLVDGKIISRVSQEVFMPFTVGGGVSTIAHIDELLSCGADKVSINTAAVRDPAFVTEAAKRFGSQCIVVSVDYMEGADGRKYVVSNAGTAPTDMLAGEFALRMQDALAGEILLTSVDRDGMMNGYDLEMIAELSPRLNVPLIASSGAGSLQHCVAALQAGASAITISSMFIFTDHSPIKVRTYLSGNGINVRSQKGSRS